MPYGQLFEGDERNLYGTTILLGPRDQGVAFRIIPKGVFTILRDFGSAPPDGTHQSMSPESATAAT